MIDSRLYAAVYALAMKLAPHVGRVRVHFDGWHSPDRAPRSFSPDLTERPYQPYRRPAVQRRAMARKQANRSGAWRVQS